ncbi:MAG: M28 family peptidase, partial [Bacteroidota bacterium]
MQTRSVYIILLLLFPFWVVSQTSFSFEEKSIEERLKTDIENLSSPEMEGREAGTPGEEKAARYVATQMKEAGLSPFFDDSYFQEFIFDYEWVYGQQNSLMIRDNNFIVNGDYFVLPLSGNVSVSAPGVYIQYPFQDKNATTESIEERILLMEYYLPDSITSESGYNLEESLKERLDIAEKEKVLGVILVNNHPGKVDPENDIRIFGDTLDFPVVFAGKRFFETWQNLPGEIIIQLSTDARLMGYTSRNVAGYIDNNAESTVVLGAHYDHLGYGGRGSRASGVHAIHYGADDNASGTAGVLETARFLSTEGTANFNYIFVAFGAEEKGLLGSRYFTRSNPYDWSKVSFMFNFDMIGRLDQGNLTLFGTGTSPVWDELIDQQPSDELNIRKNASGVGASDHTNFYREDIPVLFFFTGLHDDYHKPADTPDKINHQGARKVLQLSYYFIEKLKDRQAPVFTPTPASQSRQVSRRGPSLGFMPDHAFDGNGLRIESVLENCPAR